MIVGLPSNFFLMDHRILSYPPTFQFPEYSLYLHQKQYIHP